MLSIGSTVRKLLGARLARKAGRLYRSIFIDLRSMATVLAEAIPPNALVLDIGGGDGEPLNHLLALRSDLHITTLDPRAEVGQWIDARYSRQVTRLPRTTLAKYLDDNGAYPDTLLIADVIHHVPVASRVEFLGYVATLLAKANRLRIIVKDVEPGHWRARLGYWSDRYLTGDRGVSPISREDMVSLFQQYLGPLRRVHTKLYATDEPNYAIIFFR